VAEAILKEEYRGDLKLDEAIKLAVKCLVTAIEARGEKLTVRIAVIPSETKKFRLLTVKEAERYMRVTRIGERNRKRK